MSYSTRFDTLEEYVQTLTKQVFKIDQNQRWLRGNEINWTKAAYNQYVRSYRAAKESLHCMILALKQKRDKWVVDEVDIEQDSDAGSWNFEQESDAGSWESDPEQSESAVEKDNRETLTQTTASKEDAVTNSLSCYETMAKMLRT